MVLQYRKVRSRRHGWTLAAMRKFSVLWLLNQITAMLAGAGVLLVSFIMFAVGVLAAAPTVPAPACPDTVAPSAQAEVLELGDQHPIALDLGPRLLADFPAQQIIVTWTQCGALVLNRVDDLAGGCSWTYAYSYRGGWQFDGRYLSWCK